MFLLSLQVQIGRGAGPALAAAVLIPFALAQLLLTRSAAPAVALLGSRAVVRIGLLLLGVAAGLGWLVGSAGVWVAAVTGAVTHLSRQLGTTLGVSVLGAVAALT